MSLRRKADSRSAGFTLIEVLLSLSLMVFVIAGITAVNATFKSAIRITGHDTFGGENISINPDDTVATAARNVAVEFLSITQQARFVMAASAPWDATQATSMPKLPGLASLSALTLQNASAARSALESAGVLFSGQGYTIWIVGAGNQILGALIVSVDNVTAGNGDAFIRYKVNLLGGDSSGYGQLLAYQFVSPGTVAQQISAPQWISGSWQVSLPDPSAPSDTPTSQALNFTPKTSMVYDVVAHF